MPAEVNLAWSNCDLATDRRRMATTEMSRMMRRKFAIAVGLEYQRETIDGSLHWSDLHCNRNQAVEERNRLVICWE
jgi:hypothetical protein